MERTRVGWAGKAWIVGVFGFSVARALVVWPTLGAYGVNPWIFLLVDVLTAWPYAYGQVRVVLGVRARNWRDLQIWALVTLLAFVAPYGYIAGAGSGEMPLVSWLVLGVLIVLFGTASVIRIVRQIRMPQGEQSLAG